MSDSLEILRVDGAATWRRWLRQHHGASPGVWLVFHRTHSGKPGLTYEEALEEALCVGWIDSIVKRLDEKRYLQKFIPRRPGSDWSLVNRNRARRLLKTGRMMPEGLAATGPWIHGPEETPSAPPGEPPVLAIALRASKPPGMVVPTGLRSRSQNDAQGAGEVGREETRRGHAKKKAPSRASGKRPRAK